VSALALATGGRGCDVNPPESRAAAAVMSSQRKRHGTARERRVAWGAAPAATPCLRPWPGAAVPLWLVGQCDLVLGDSSVPYTAACWPGRADLRADLRRAREVLRVTVPCGCPARHTDRQAPRKTANWGERG
jgi:hypothetical protein